MFHKFTKQNFQNAMNKTKSFMGTAYHHTKSFLGHVDHGVKTAKKIYAILEPSISHFAGETRSNKINQGIMKAVTTYDDIKHKVVNHHDTIENHARGIHDKFKKAGLSIGME